MLLAYDKSIGKWCLKLLFEQAYANSGEAIDMEACFSQLTLDVIGKSVFNYDFDALKTDSPIIQVIPLCGINELKAPRVKFIHPAHQSTIALRIYAIG